MPRNLKGGKQAKRKSNKDYIGKSKKEMVYPSEEENSHVGKVTSVLGDKRFKVLILSNTGLKNETMMSHLSRTASKRQGRIIVDSIVKISKRDFEDKCDILYQYSQSEIDQLIQEKYIVIENDNSNNNDVIEFSNEVDNDEIDISDI